MTAIINKETLRQYIKFYLKKEFLSLPKELQNTPIGDWDVSNITDMSYLFSYKYDFNEPLNKWDVSNVTNMTDMFKHVHMFNQPLNEWNVSNVINMCGMFHNAISFNQPLDNWNVSNVTNMSDMFSCAYRFNQPLNNWNVSNVTNMCGMFHNARSFNQPHSLDNWDVSNINNNMCYMFENTRNFNKKLGRKSQNLNNCDELKSIIRPIWVSSLAYSDFNNTQNVIKTYDLNTLNNNSMNYTFITTDDKQYLIRLDKAYRPIYAEHILISFNNDPCGTCKKLLMSFDEGILWLEFCPYSDILVAAHFNIAKGDKFDELILKATELGCNPCPNYLA